MAGTFWNGRVVKERAKTALGVVLFSLVLLGCGEDPQQLFETAQFEEKQRNRAHAQELYERIIRDHPDSSVAQQARARLEAWKTEEE